MASRRNREGRKRKAGYEFVPLDPVPNPFTDSLDEMFDSIVSSFQIPSRFIVGETSSMTEQEWLTCDDPGRMLKELQWMGEKRNTGQMLMGFPVVSTTPYKLSDRKLRLFCCACSRQTMHLLTDERSRRIIDIGERMADGGEKATARDWRAVQDLRREIANRTNNDLLDQRQQAVYMVTTGIEADMPAMTLEWSRRTDLVPAALQASFLRDIIGNPFRPVTMPYSQDCTPRCQVYSRLTQQLSKATRCGGCKRDWLCPWLTPTVRSLAEAAYIERAVKVCEECYGDGVCETNTGGNICQYPCLDCHGSGTVSDGTLDADRLAVLADCLEDAGCDNADILKHLRSPSPHVRGCHVLDMFLGKE